MRICFIFILVVHTVCALTSIQVQNSSIHLGKADVDIRCLVNDSENERILGIQLIKSNANILSVTETEVFFQDEELEQRAFAEGSVMNATSSYLQMVIVRQNVTKNDGGIYFCKSFAALRNQQESDKIFLNITETKKNNTNDVCGYKPSQHSFLLVLLAMLIHYKGM